MSRAPHSVTDGRPWGDRNFPPNPIISVAGWELGGFEQVAHGPQGSIRKRTLTDGAFVTIGSDMCPGPHKVSQMVSPSRVDFSRCRGSGL